MQKILLLLLILVVANCATTSPIDYQPSPMSLPDATNMIDKLTMIQRQGWAPDSIEINDKYILWNEGGLSEVSTGFANLGEPTIHSRSVAHRLYYDSNDSIVISPWSGDHYVVSIRN